MKACITTPVHECASADTTSATITLDNIDITICSFSRGRSAYLKVEKLAKALEAILSLQD